MGHELARTFECRWKLLDAACDRIAVAHTLDALIDVFHTTARAVCSADGATFVLRDGDHCRYVEEDAVGPLWKGQRFPMADCISGWCMLNGETAAIEDIFADPRIPHDAYRRTFVKSLVMAPVSPVSPKAAIGAYWSHRRRFTEREIETVGLLALCVGETMAQLGRA